MARLSQLCFAIRRWRETDQALHVEKCPLLLRLDVSQASGSNTCQLQPTFRRPDQGPRNLFSMARKLKGERAAVHG